MSEQFLGQIEIFGFNFAPRNWNFCNGQLLPINQFSALFSLLGTTYGGNGVQNFALPNLQSAIPITAGQGPGLSNYVLGQTGGSETVVLQTNQMATHNHTVAVDATTAPTSNTNVPTGHLLGQSAGATQAGGALKISVYGTGTPNGALDPRSVSTVGGGGHENRMPYLAINFCIALQGIFPSRN